MSSVIDPNIDHLAGQKPSQIDDFCPSEDDFRAVRQVLRHLFPLELVEKIIDLGSYWPKIRASSADVIDVFGGELYCYLVTPPIPGAETAGAPLQRSVRQIRFKIDSCDQGWCDYNAQNRGTYNGSWTWFEAVILPPPATLDDPSWYQNALIMPTKLGPDASPIFSPAQNGQSRRWHIQSNITAWRASKEHIITWTTDEANIEEREHDRLNGRTSRGHEVVRSLVAGDRLAIIAGAVSPRWVNHVVSASIEIFYHPR
ncbi:hypothetical protein K435DRAFT_83644 [Dendrothele bispora CBS 962.96]|uniref:Uncharacterized protein n=1 Tax=Dendrothele bispora (strain CBS 962.96) TaxID=1314807 RepID=A0A4S8M3R8_DENBC|nr:hypothetical protein K435DRAFT_83644 [Dendrothele bispora CBS 962.96]